MLLVVIHTVDSIVTATATRTAPLLPLLLPLLLRLLGQSKDASADCALHLLRMLATLHLQHYEGKGS